MSRKVTIKKEKSKFKRLLFEKKDSFLDQNDYLCSNQLIISMRKAIMVAVAALLTLPSIAQSKASGKDSTVFQGYLYNKKYNVYICMDFYHNNIVVPYQELFGELPGYFGDKQDGRKWLFTSATIRDKHTADLQITNDYGSEDLVAMLTQVNDSTFRLKQGKGSTMKIARNRKWVKMPTELDFIKK